MFPDAGFAEACVEEEGSYGLVDKQPNRETPPTVPSSTRQSNDNPGRVDRERLETLIHKQFFLFYCFFLTRRTEAGEHISESGVGEEGADLHAKRVISS